jgi:exodeoxyribonuclease III
MALKVATWNINSVRLRIGLVERVLNELKPDVLCLQETKCPQGQFPSAPLHQLGYKHIAEFGQKGYHGVAIVSRLPFKSQVNRAFCDKNDCRHVSIVLDAGKPITLHNLYVPAGGDEPDPKINEKFAHKLQFLDELEAWFGDKAIPKGHSGIVVGDLNVAPYEHDVWSHKDLLKVVSHTPVETEALIRIMKAGGWIDLMRQHRPMDQKLYTWWSYRAKDWRLSNRGRRLDHIWGTPDISASCSAITIHEHARDWEKCSDHVPVMATFDLHDF